MVNEIISIELEDIDVLNYNFVLFFTINNEQNKLAPNTFFVKVKQKNLLVSFVIQEYNWSKNEY